MFCSQCGNKLEENAKFCSFCGAKVVNSVVSTNNSPQSTQPISQVVIAPASPPTENVEQKIIIGNFAFPNGVEIYTSIQKRLYKQIPTKIEGFASIYDTYDSISSFLEDGEEFGYSLIGEVFMSFSDLFAANGRYDITENTLLNHPLAQNVFAPFSSTVQAVENELNMINGNQLAADQDREARKNSRFRIIGGGFGITGALKGMAMAGAFNASTGLAYDISNSLSRLSSSLDAVNDRTDLFNKSKDFLVSSLRTSLQNVALVVSDILGVSVSFSPLKSDNILANINSNIIRGPAVKPALIEAIKAYPYNELSYKMYLHFFPEDSESVSKVANFFGVNIPITNKNKCLSANQAFQWKYLDEYKDTIRQCTDFYFTPDIPYDKLTNAVNRYGNVFNINRDDVLMLYDDTIFGNAKDGFMLLKDGIVAHSSIEDTLCYVKLKNILELVLKNKDELIANVYNRKEPMSIFISKGTNQLDTFVEMVNHIINAF